MRFCRTADGRLLADWSTSDCRHRSTSVNSVSGHGTDECQGHRHELHDGTFDLPTPQRTTGACLTPVLPWMRNIPLR